MKRCSCGELVAEAARYHWVDFGARVGHYVDEGGQPAGEELVLPESWTPALRRAADLFGPPPAMAPPPGPVPKKIGWLLEAELRGIGSDLMRTLGFVVYDLEQEYRADGSSRVTEGIGDSYFQGRGIRGWIEWKRWDNEPSDKQRAFALEELGQGGIYLLVYETAQLVTWNQIREAS